MISAIITPVPKIAKQVNPADFRPISVTSNIGKIHRETLFYPSLQLLPPGLDFTDQYSFRPSGSTTAALVAFFQVPHHIRTLLSANPFVFVYSFDFIVKPSTPSVTAHQ